MKIHAGQGIEDVNHLQKIPVSSVGKNGKNCLPFTKNIDHGERVPSLHTERLSGADYLELVWKAGTCKWNKEIHSKSSSRENRTTFSDGPLISGVSSWMNQKSVCHLHSNRNFRNFLASGKQPEIHIRLVTSLGVWTRLIEAQNVLAARFSDLKYWKSS